MGTRVNNSFCVFALFLVSLCPFPAPSWCHGARQTEEKERYLLYTVNPGEGFNLRRDVHMRAAVLVKKLREAEARAATEDGLEASPSWVLVLPPWPRLFHWKSSTAGEDWTPWRAFFDLESLNGFVPCIEFEEYLGKVGGAIDEVMVLQPYEEGWGGRWEEKMDERPCIDPPHYREKSPGVWKGDFYGRADVYARRFRCVSVQGFNTILVKELMERVERSVLVARFEQLLHSDFGGVDYWNARSSMVYARHLRQAGNEFMRTHHLDPASAAVAGNWRENHSEEREEEGKEGEEEREGEKDQGGLFLSVHYRRRDYVRARPNVVPDAHEAAAQISVLLGELQLERVFLATDAPLSEKEHLASLVTNSSSRGANGSVGVVWYHPSPQDLLLYGEGGVAIIDQWVASHAAYFVGSKESTFSFRIREDRLLMGFDRHSTFNHLCGGGTGDPHACAPPTYWPLPLPGPLASPHVAGHHSRQAASRQEL